MDGRIVHHDNGLLRDRVTKGIKTPYDHTSVDRLFKHRGMHIIVAIHQSSDIHPSISHRREFNDFTRFLPRIGEGRIQGKSRFIKVIEIDLALVFLCLQGFKCTVTFGQCFRISETFERLSYPFPSKACLVGQTFQRRNTEALLGCVGSSLHHLFERTGVFFDRVLREFLFVWGEFGWSATARVIMQTLGAMAFPCLDPGRHGDAMDLIGLCNGRDGRACGTQQQTMGAAPRSECGILLHRLFSECTLLVGQRLHISHDHHLIRS